MRAFQIASFTSLALETSALNLQHRSGAAPAAVKPAADAPGPKELFNPYKKKLASDADKTQADSDFKLVVDAGRDYNGAKKDEKSAKETAYCDAKATFEGKHANVNVNESVKAALRSYMVAMILMILGGVLLLGGVGYYFYAGAGMPVYAVSGTGLVILIVGLILLFTIGKADVPACAAPAAPAAATMPTCDAKKVEFMAEHQKKITKAESDLFDLINNKFRKNGTTIKIEGATDEARWAKYREVIGAFGPIEEKELNEDQKKRLLVLRKALRKVTLDEVYAFEMNCLISEIASAHALKDEAAKDAFLAELVRQKEALEAEYKKNYCKDADSIYKSKVVTVNGKDETLTATQVCGDILQQNQQDLSRKFWIRRKEYIEMDIDAANKMVDGQAKTDRLAKLEADLKAIEEQLRKIPKKGEKDPKVKYVIPDEDSWDKGDWSDALKRLFTDYAATNDMRTPANLEKVHTVA